MKELSIRVIGTDVRDLKEELERNGAKVSYILKESVEFTSGAFSDILIQYGVGVASELTVVLITEIIYGWIKKKKKQEYPKIINVDNSVNIQINNNDSLKMIKDKLQIIEKES